MQDLLDFGGEKDWYGISSLFALNSTDKAEILYDYVINLIEITALLN